MVKGWERGQVMSKSTSGPVLDRQAYDSFWIPSWETLYKSYYQEVLSETLFRRWYVIDVVAGILAAATAAGSGIAGWAWWTSPSGRSTWAIIAGSAVIVAIVHRVMAVPGRIKSLEEIRRNFLSLRVESEIFRDRLKIGIVFDEANNTYDKLQNQYRDYMAKTPTPLFLSLNLKRRIQQDLNERLKDRTRQDGKPHDSSHSPGTTGPNPLSPGIGTSSWKPQQYDAQARPGL